ncbi:hypothetical protein BVY01_04495 [bacterium I07]|nr:hypothetical protein BVY01_04495 [bacterium I07]
MTDVENRHKALARYIFEEGWNKQNPDIVDEVFTPEFVYHGVANNRDEFKQFWKVVLAAIPDIHFTLEDQIAEGDMTVHRWVFTGTHLGEWMGVPATGKKVVVPGMDIARFKDGKIAENWGIFDAVSMFQQMGAYPPME